MREIEIVLLGTSQAVILWVVSQKKEGARGVGRVKRREGFVGQIERNKSMILLHWD